MKSKKILAVISCIGMLACMLTACGNTKDIEEDNSTQTINYNVGDYITFGSYEQDNNTANGLEDIEWLVLDVQDGKVLVVSNYALDCKPYNEEIEEVTWETCTLRSWLNDEFINTAFTVDEQSQISATTVVNAGNSGCGTDGGNDTTDKVFLLSIEEAEEYFLTDDVRKCAPTDYAIAQGATISESESTGGRATGWWWLRSPGNNHLTAAGVIFNGNVRFNLMGNHAYEDGNVVRPALWINLDS